MPHSPEQASATLRGVIRLEQAGDRAAIQDMYCEAFGPGRFARTAYRIRESADFETGLSCVVDHGGTVAGSIRFSAIRIGDRAGALLLGPLVVGKAFRGYNYGVRLMGCGMDSARSKGYRLVVLVGDLAYYEKAGFVRVTDGQVRLPAPYNPYRLLAYELVPGALEDYHGLVQASNRAGQQRI